MSQQQRTLAWEIKKADGFDGLRQTEKELPTLGEYECFVKIHAVSLNYRDLLISKGMYTGVTKVGLVPGSDGAGRVEAVGKKVSEFSVGDNVCTLFNQAHQAGPITPAKFATGLGGSLDGTLRKYAIFPQTGLVLAPKNLTMSEASTLTCAPLTAWNALYGLQSNALKAGDVVLTQGSGGVSLAAIQFVRAAGGIVIATTSSAAKAERLKALGAHHVINYNTDPNWGDTAKSLSRNKLGVDFVIEVGGAGTLEQSLKAIRQEGTIAVIGILGGVDKADQPRMLEALARACVVRGILIGSRLLFEDMNQAIEANNIRPVIDEKHFGFADVKEAYKYQWDQKNFGKVVINVCTE